MARRVPAPPVEVTSLTTTRYRAEDAVRAAKTGDYDKTRRMLLAALKALPPKEGS